MPKRGPRPSSWRSGPDPVQHTKYRAWIQQRNQAQFRREPWDLSFEDWLGLWGDDYDRRGRLATDLCLTRSDLEQGWSRHNCTLMERREHMRRCGERKHNENV
jgi:hypothetical protein